MKLNKLSSASIGTHFNLISKSGFGSINPSSLFPTLLLPVYTLQPTSMSFKQDYEKNELHHNPHQKWPLDAHRTRMQRYHFIASYWRLVLLYYLLFLLFIRMRFSFIVSPTKYDARWLTSVESRSKRNWRYAASPPTSDAPPWSATASSVGWKVQLISKCREPKAVYTSKEEENLFLLF